MKFISKLQRKFSRQIASLQLSPLAKTLRRSGLTYLSTRRLRNLESCLTHVNALAVPGDILEFGVALGGSGILLAHGMGAGRRYFGFDVFGMIPMPNSAVDSEDSLRRYDVISSGQSKGIGDNKYYGYEQNLLDKVKQSFREFGLVDESRTHFVKGLFEQTFPKVEIGSVALVHIDCDWHDPVKYCLEQVAPKISKNGMIIIDDYNDYKGAKLAVDNFLESNQNFSVVKNSENLIIARKYTS